MNIKAIAFDLDGTFLSIEKKLIQENIEAIQRAGNIGISIIPATGRFWKTIPDVLKELDVIDYVISINGAFVINKKNNEVIYESTIPYEQALTIYDYLDSLDCLYDGYLENDGYMPTDHKRIFRDYCLDPHYIPMVENFRHPVDDFKGMIKERKQGLQKIQVHVNDLNLKQYLINDLENRFPGIVATSSVLSNVEINASGANKGDALKAIAKHKGISMEQTCAFGDGLNDFSMIRAAGWGVCMENGDPKCKEVADYIAPHCNEAGLAQAINKFILQI